MNTRAAETKTGKKSAGRNVRNVVVEPAKNMSKELLLVVDAVANEKGVPKAVIFDAMEAALASAAKKRYLEQDVAVRVAIDRESGDYETFRRWEVVPDDIVMESPDRMIRLMDAVDEKPGIEVGGFVAEQIENTGLGRVA